MAERSPLKLNLIANFGGQTWITVVGVLVVPIYLRYLSVELYGILGVFWTLQNLLSVLDIGLSSTLNRELARLSPFPDKLQEMRDLARTLEIPYWLLGGCVSMLAFFASPYLAEHWVNSATIPVDTISSSFKLMSIGLAFQWTTSLYSGGLLGLERQVAYNTVNVFCQTIRSIGSVCTLAFLSPTIQTFLIWQVIWSFVTAVIFALVFWESMPSTGSPAKFQIALLSQIWRFATGMTGNTVAWLILTQTDKIILSRMLTLEVFGYYALASLLASTGLTALALSVSKAYYPQFSRFVALGDTASLKAIYHKSSQVMSCLLIPVTAVLTFFSYHILLLWTQNAEIAEKAYVLLSLLAIGYGISGLLLLPSYMQWANGLTKLYFWQNIVGIILVVPVMIFGTLNYGAVGAPASYLILYLLYVSVGMKIMHRFLLQGELKKWYLDDVGLPALLISLSVALCWFFYPPSLSPLLSIFFLVFISIVAMTISFLVVPYPRKWVLEFVFTKFRGKAV